MSQHIYIFLFCGVIAGTGDIWPRGSKFMKSGKAMIKTLEPIDMSKYNKESIEQLVKDTHHKMKNVYDDMTLKLKS